MLPVEAQCAFWVHIASKIAILGASLLLCICRVSELRRACFCQARVAQAPLLPGALFHAGAFALPAVPPNPTCAGPTFGAFRSFPKQKKAPFCKNVMVITSTDNRSYNSSQLRVLTQFCRKCAQCCNCNIN